ncbi:MAG: DEAD/DEAH box helicase family protein [Acidobacteriota bacterium]|nr:DEAD/DEAH box helicase family protein [Acidobacteriota bacterium]
MKSSRLVLTDFQQEAADKLVDSALNYFQAGQDKMGGRPVPFVGQLKAVTGAGKTPILATAIGRLTPAIILWTTKFGSVVDQTVTNLSPGGKYHHLLGNTKAVEVLNFSDIQSPARWQRILENKEGLTILVSTVAAWNSSVKDDRLNVHRSDPNSDWGEKSRWEQLKTLRQRPLYVVYDEAHNTTTEQVELLDDLDPSGFFIASASPIKGKLQQYLTLLPEDQRQERIVSVSTRAVVDAQLLKSTISLADYDSSTEEMIEDAVKRRNSLEKQMRDVGSATTPKAIYVVETSNTATKGVDPRPVAIWKQLVNQCGVSPASIAVCTSTKALPQDALRVDSVDQLSDDYTHIIFNKKLQEGWDDPSVYVCYFDGKTDSATRIQQVIGRALRQPEAKHLTDEELNTAYFLVRCPNEALEKIVDQLKEELRIYKDDSAPDGFEPFQFKEERKSLSKISLRPEYVKKLTVPRLQLELPGDDRLRKLIKKRTYDLGADDRAAPGRALVNIVSVRTGEVESQTRDLLEDMRARCGAYLQGQIRVLSKNCSDSIPPNTFSNSKLDKSACYKSKALDHYYQLAIEVVNDYETHVQLAALADADNDTYTVNGYQPSGTVRKEFTNAGHPYYDSKAFNLDELEMAKALDKFSDHLWVRNKDRIDYGIPLPIKSGTSSTFFPDFIWWVGKTVWLLDPTGKHILNEKIRGKLLAVPPPLKIALISRGKFDPALKNKIDDGWTLLRFRIGNALPETFDTLDELLSVLVAASDLPKTKRSATPGATKAPRTNKAPRATKTRTLKK